VILNQDGLPAKVGDILKDSALHIGELTPDRVKLVLEVPAIFRPLVERKRLVKIYFGGRGSGKSMSFAAAVVWLCLKNYPIMGQNFRVLCGREFQNSIAESVYYDLVRAMHRMGVRHKFKCTRELIYCYDTGAEVYFRGMHNNIEAIKSLGGIALFWGEESNNFSNDTLTYLFPTLRLDPPHGPFGQGSEFWFSFNQVNDDDPIYANFQCSRAPYDDGRRLVISCTWRHNRFFPRILDEQRREMKDNDQLGLYSWVWETECRNLMGVFFTRDMLLVNKEAIDPPQKPDMVFAVVDTAAKTGRENDGTAVTWFSYTDPSVAGRCDFPLVILDYEIMQIRGDLLSQWLPSVKRHCEALVREVDARYGIGTIWIEDKSTGTVLIQANADDPTYQPIDTKLTAAGKVERAIAAAHYVSRGLVKISRRAYDKTLVYKGVHRNHLLGQVLAFRVSDVETIEDDALDTFCYGVLIALGTSEGY
jgi:hypothetical protein